MEGLESRKGLYGFDFLEHDERRVPEGEDRKIYDIKQMWQRTHEIVNLAARGFKNVQIADILDIHPQTVSNTLNSTLGEKKLSEIRECRDDEAKQVSEKIRVLTDKALRVYNKLLDTETVDPELQKKAADTVVLELSGLRVPTKVQSSSVHAVLTAEELDAFKLRGLQAARDSGMIVDVTPKVIEEVKQEESHEEA